MDKNGQMHVHRAKLHITKSPITRFIFIVFHKLAFRDAEYEQQELVLVPVENCIWASDSCLPLSASSSF